MNNLIITIISIALVAVALIAGAYYGGVAYSNAQINATANSIMNEAQQILYAERLWSTNNNQPDISGMGSSGATGTGMSMLVSSGALSEWPSLGGTLGMSTTLTNPGPQPWNSSGAATVSTGSYDAGCYSVNGNLGTIRRIPYSYNSQNYVQYQFATHTTGAGCSIANGRYATSTTDVSEINHPMVKIAKAINAAVNQISANADTSTMPYIGLPLPPTGDILATVYDTTGGTFANAYAYVDANGTIQTNYCYLYPIPSNIILCTFGPS